MRGLGRPKAALVVAPSEREILTRWTRRRKTAQGLALRARIILRCATGRPNTVVARELGITHQTVGKWRARFVAQRLDGLLDEPRPGTPRRLSDAKIEEIVVKTLESTPPDATQWSVRTMAQATGIGATSVHRIWRAFALQPHRTKSFKLSTDPLFVEKVRDIVGLYLRPPTKALVLCVDEKSQIQALDRTQPLLPMRPGQVERRDVAAQDVEVAPERRVGLQVDARLDHRFAAALGAQPLLHRGQDLAVGHVQAIDVGPGEICEVNLGHCANRAMART